MNETAGTGRPVKWLGVTNDDRGTERGVISGASLRRDPRMADARFRVVVDRVRRQIVSRGRGPLIAILMGVSGPVIVFGSIKLRVPLTVAVLVIVLLAVVVGRLLVLRGRRRSAPAVSTVMLADGLCPACSYSFAGLGPAEDGCFECPECGAAWNASRVVRRTHFEEVAGTGFAAPVRWWQRIGGHMGLRRLKDDRGHEGPAADARLREALRATSDPDRRARLLSARRRTTRDGVILRVALFLLYSGLAGFQVWLLLPQLRSRPYSVMGVLMIVGAFGFLWLAQAFLRSNAGIRGKTLRFEMLSRALCPRCAADLTGLVPEPDGCLVCRECAAAWKPPLAAPADFASPPVVVEARA
ncbi:hypothetical protein PHYC_03509 [Phycisphaerales bacterium]|nr:hypothetical protein PHYC_03509 [Phycisphaerales bacterium]